MKNVYTLLVLLLGTLCLQAQTDPDTTKVDENEARLTQLKTEVQQLVDNRAKMAQVMVDKVFSFSELGFQEEQTSKYITDILKKNGFKIEYGISGVPTA